MARIRSVHPGLFTDEAFMALSDAAQVLFIGLWTEADDQGVFEWKPITLRARLRPAKDGSIEPLLSELEAANCIRSYEMDGRKLGAIRNFRKFQRPKSPNALYLMTPEIRNYVRLDDAITETPPLEPSPVPPKAEKSPQMEDGGGKGRREAKQPAAVPEAARETAQPPPPKPTDQRVIVGDRVLELARIDPASWMQGFSLIEAWLTAGYDPDQDIYPTVREIAARPGYKPPKTLKYFHEAIEEAWKKRQLDIPASLARKAPKTAFEQAIDAWVASGRQGSPPKLADYPVAA